MVANLTRNVSETHVREIFTTFGALRDVELAIEKSVNLPKGFAYVSFEKADDAQRAMEYMNGGQIDGNVIK